MELSQTDFDCSHVGTNNVILTVTDKNGNESTASAVITVEDNVPPIISCLGDQTRDTDPGLCNYTVVGTEFDATFTDNCSAGSITNDYNNSASLNGAIFPKGSTTVTWTADDGNGQTAFCNTVIEIEDNEDPVASCVAPFTIQLNNNGAANVTVADIDDGTSHDNCGNTIMSVSPGMFSCNDAVPPVSSLNIGESVEHSLRGRTVTFTNMDLNSTGSAVATVEPGSTVTFTASWTSEYTSDFCPGCVQQFYIGVKGQAIDCMYSGFTASTISGNGSFSFTAPTDPGLYVVQAASSLEYSCTLTAAGLSDSKDNAIGYIIVPGNVTLTVTDDSGNTSTCQTNVIVEDNVPPVVVTKDITVQLDANGTASIVPADIDNGSSDNCDIANLSLDVSDFRCNDVGNPVTVTLTVEDVNGNSNSNTATVKVEDNVEPVVATKDITVQLDANGNASIVPADIDNGSSDNCDIATSSLDVSDFSCNDVGNPVTVTLTVEDVNGNSNSETATITIEDNIAPVARAKDITVQLDDNGNASIVPADIDNGSTDACGIESYLLDITEFDGDDVNNPVTVKLTVTDVNGNSNSETAVVTVEDNIAPVARAKDITVQLDDSGNASIVPADVNNGSADNWNIASMSVTPNSFDCADALDTVLKTLFLKLKEDIAERVTLTGNHGQQLLMRN